MPWARCRRTRCAPATKMPSPSRNEPPTADVLEGLIGAPATSRLDILPGQSQVPDWGRVQAPSLDAGGAQRRIHWQCSLVTPGTPRPVLVLQLPDLQR